MSRNTLSWLRPAAIFALILSFAHAGEVKIEEIALKDVQGGTVKFSEFAHKAAIVITAHGRSCPVLRQNLSTLKALKDKFERRNVAFLMVNGTIHDKVDEIKDELGEYQIDFPVLVDPEQVLLKALSLRTVGETVILNPENWQVIYRGAIDDRVNFDRALPKARHAYVENALNQVLAHRKITQSSTQVFGCSLSLK
jgi:peroxiredoxin